MNVDRGVDAMYIGVPRVYRVNAKVSAVRSPAAVAARKNNNNKEASRCVAPHHAHFVSNHACRSDYVYRSFIAHIDMSHECFSVIAVALAWLSGLSPQSGRNFASEREQTVVPFLHTVVVHRASSCHLGAR